MPLKLDMEKAATSLRLSLDKGGVTPPECEVAFDLDVSGSFEQQHKSGRTNLLLSRLVPWGMVFDPDKKLDVFTFSDSRENAYYVGEITPANHEGYVYRGIINNVPGWCGRTDYSYVLEKNLQHFGWGPQPQDQSNEEGFFNRWFKRKKSAQKLVGRRSLIIFVTDGEDSSGDECRTHQVMAESEQRGDKVYFLLIGIGRQNFPFLQELADRYGNVGITVINDLDTFVAMSDEELNDELIGDELLEWLKQ